MRVKIGSKWFEVALGQPIMVEFSDKDLENVRNMPALVRCYASALDDEFLTRDAYLAWMNADPSPPRGEVVFDEVTRKFAVPVLGALVEALQDERASDRPGLYFDALGEGYGDVILDGHSNLEMVAEIISAKLWG